MITVSGFKMPSSSFPKVWWGTNISNLNSALFPSKAISIYQYKLGMPLHNVIFNIKTGYKKQRIRNCNKREEGKNSNGFQDQNWAVQIYCLYVGLISPELLAQLNVNRGGGEPLLHEEIWTGIHRYSKKKVQLSSVYMSKIISLMFFLIHGFYFVTVLDGDHEN